MVKNGIAEVKGEYEPNFFKRMLKRINTKSIGAGKEEKTTDGKTETSKKKAVKKSAFNEYLKDKAKLTPYDKISNAIDNAKDLKDIDEIAKGLNDKCKAGDITKSELSGLISHCNIQKTRLENNNAKLENESEKEVENS